MNDNDSSSLNSSTKDDTFNEWRPAYPLICAYHDIHSLAGAWCLGPPTTMLEAIKPTGASQARSPSEEDNGDGKCNTLIASCPAFRNEIGNEPVRHLSLSRRSVATFSQYQNNLPTVSNQKNKYAISSLSDDCTETWMREHTAAEAGVLEDVSNVYLGGRLCASRQSKIIIEPQDIGSYYFRHCFTGRPHIEFFGIDEQLGPVAISVVKENPEKNVSNQQNTFPTISKGFYRMIVRISDLLTMRVAVPEDALQDSGHEKSNRALMRELVEIVCPQVLFSCLRPAIPNLQKIEELLLKIDEQPIYTRYKIGVLLCKENQSTEEEMYNNEKSTPAFEEFLEFLGSRVRLKGFDQYKGGLDTKADTTGTHSIYTEYQAHEIMFHISTMLPFTPNNKQQLLRKRHIGNDMVTIIFQEPGALPFSPITVRSHFQHVFIIVRVNNPCTDNVSYTIAISRAKDVPTFGPVIPNNATFGKSTEFHDFLITKIINAENAVHRSKKFAAMAARARRESLKDLAENYVAAHPNEVPSRIASRFLGGSVKRKERPIPKPIVDSNLRGALSWLVEVYDYSLNQRVQCVLGVSAESIVLLEIPTGDCLFFTPTHSVLGWATIETGIKMYYDHGEMLLFRVISSDGFERESSVLLKRLGSVTNGDEAKEMILRRSKISEALGFHIQDEGVVTDVEMYHPAWKAGLRQGSRIVEIDNISVSTMSLDQMFSLLTENTTNRVMVIAPSSDGSPRRGCEDPNCPAVKGQDALLLTPETFAKQPLTYQEMFRIKNKELPHSPHSSPSNSFDERLGTIRSSNSHLNQEGSSMWTKDRSISLNEYSENSLSTLNMPPRSPSLNPANTMTPERPNCVSQCINPLARTLSDELLINNHVALNSPNNIGIMSVQNSLEGIHSLGSPCDIIPGGIPLNSAEFQQRCYLRLQRLVKERKEQDALIEKLKTELITEKQQHEETKHRLTILQTICDGAQLTIPETDAEL
uniref:Signal-induced proliferation-associated 1-like protein 1 (inferred by orthology to a human protein) n=1 Tax=Strongyloides venezuelensis TaxID=75913 RepID=A0A0K0FAP0_STRVS